MFQTIDVMNKALDATMLRVNVLSNNIANAETPGFKREDVRFQGVLQQKIDTYGYENVSAEMLSSEVYTDRESVSMRIDGNNVDIDTEMSELAQTKLRYDTLIQRTSAQIGRYKYILQNIK